MLTAIFTQPRTDEIHISKMVNPLLQSLFAARKLNYIIIYICHYKIFKKQRKLQPYTIKNVLQVKDKATRETGSSKCLKLPTKIWYWVLTPTETRKMIEWMKCIYIAHISHIISWRFTIVFIEWDWTSACEGTSCYRHHFIIYLISLTHPSHAWNEGRNLN